MNEVSLNTLKVMWKNKGKYYGYPDCCINDFVERNFDEGLSAEQEKTYNHGFIPCQKCAERILKGETTLELLITNRRHNNPYPND